MKVQIQKRPTVRLDARFFVGAIGLVLSVALHELFHVLVHWGNITGVGVLTSPGTIAEITVVTERGYDTSFEEAIAYMITGTVMLITIMIIWKLHDARDTRSFEQIVFPER